VDKDHSGTVGFPEHILLVARIREEMKKRRHDETLQLFKNYDKDNSGNLSMQECSSLFAEMGMLPKCQVGQDEIKRLLDEADEDGSGELNFEEFQTLTELVAEKLRALARSRELEFGATLNFSKRQVNEYRDAFWKLDQDGSGELGINELRTVMNLLQRKVSGDELRALFDEVDQDGSGFIDFTEFLSLMHVYQVTEQEELPEVDLQDKTQSAAKRQSVQPNRQSILAASKEYQHATKCPAPH
jgi:Ca2+-binding EF-hand superfamily protein